MLGYAPDPKLLRTVNPANAICDADVGAVLENETSVCERISKIKEQRVTMRSNFISAMSCDLVGFGFFPDEIDSCCFGVGLGLGLNAVMMTAMWSFNGRKQRY